MNLLIAAAVALLLLLWHYRVPWTLVRSQRIVVLTAMAGLAVLNWQYFGVL